MWGIAAIAVVDRYGDPAFLKIFFHPSLTLTPPSFSSCASSSELPSSCMGSCPDEKKSSSASCFSVRKEDALSIHLLLFSALDKSESILVEEVRKRMASEGGMDGTAAFLKNSSRRGPSSTLWEKKKSLEGIKKDPWRRLVDVDCFPLLSSVSPAYRKEGGKATSARRETVPFVEDHTKARDVENASPFSEDGLEKRDVILSPRVEYERCRKSLSMHPSSSLFLHPSSVGIPSAIPSSSPASPLSQSHPHSPGAVSPLEEVVDTPFMGTSRIHSSPFHASTDLRTSSPEGRSRRRTRFSAIVTGHAASSTEATTTCTSSPTTVTTVRSRTSSTYSSSHSTSRSSSDESSHSFSSSGASPHHFLSSPFSLSPSPSPTASLYRDPHQWVENDLHGRPSSPTPLSSVHLRATTKYHSGSPARTHPLSASPSLHGQPSLHRETREGKENQTTSSSASPPLFWISASSPPSSFSPFPPPFLSHPSHTVSHTKEGSTAPLSPPAEPQYLGKVAASSDERFQCYACCAGTGMRVFVVAVTRRRCGAPLSSLRLSASISSSSDETPEAHTRVEKRSLHPPIQEDATQESSGEILSARSTTERRRKTSATGGLSVSSSSFFSSSSSAYSSITGDEGEEEVDALLHREGSTSLQEDEGSEPTDDAMIPITRSILESASIASCNPLNGPMNESRLSSVHSPFSSTLEDVGPFFSRESPRFFSTTNLHPRLLPSLNSLKTVLLNSRSFHLQLERIIASLECTS